MSHHSDGANIGRLIAVIRHKIGEGKFEHDGDTVLVALAPYPADCIKSLIGYSPRKSRTEGFRVVEVINTPDRWLKLRIEVLDEHATA